MKRILIALLAAGTALMLGGCETDNSGPVGKSTLSSASGAQPGRNSQWLIPVAKVNSITKGMSADEVRGILGAPDRVEPFRTAQGVESNVWIYNLAVEQIVQQISSGVREVPAWDPIANIATTTREPILTNQRVRRNTTLELLMVDGHLVERRPGHQLDSAID